jgi:hypothetical protein
LISDQEVILQLKLIEHSLFLDFGADSNIITDKVLELKGLRANSLDDATFLEVITMEAFVFLLELHIDN